MTTTTATKKKTTITLSDRPPVRIVIDDWPLLADVSTFWGGNGIECQANEEAFIKVRQHTDGRTLVYGNRDRGLGGMPINYRGTSAGFLLESSENVGQTKLPTASADIVRAIRRVAGVIGTSELGDDCIADLPAEDLK